MFKTNLQSAPRLDGPNRAVIVMDSPEYEITLLENDPLDNVDYSVVFISTSAIANPVDIPGDDGPLYIGASADVSGFGYRGDSAIADVYTEKPAIAEGNMFPVFSSTSTNVSKLYRDVPDEGFDSTISYVHKSGKAIVYNNDISRLAGTWIEYDTTKYAYVNSFNEPESDTLNITFTGTSAVVINNSIDPTENTGDVKTSLLTLQNLVITVNPKQFLEIKLEFGSQINEIEQLPPGLILDTNKRIIGVIQYSGEYDIVIKLASGDTLDAKIICLPITRLA